MVSSGEISSPVGLPDEPTFQLRATTPPGRLYTDPSVLETELERGYYRRWLQIGREDRLPEKGDFLTVDVGREKLLIARDGTGTLRAFYNLCRHRGTQVELAKDGKGKHSFSCPYHSWTYALDGRLMGAPHTKGIENFDKGAYGLHPVRIETWGGFLWVNLEPQGASLRDELGSFLGLWDRFDLASLKFGGRLEYEVDANWKILVENFSECYHCAPVHPSLNKLTPYMSGDNDAFFHAGTKLGLFSGGYMQFTKDYTSMTRTGYTNRPLVPGITAEDARRVYYYTVFPNMFFSLHPDFLMIHRAWPTTPSHSRIENEFYFHPDAVRAPGFDPSDAIGLWDEINRQDWEVCTLAQRGVSSRAWTGGRYSEQETLTADFDAYVTEELARRD